jgi:hypothetical protein
MTEPPRSTSFVGDLQYSLACRINNHSRMPLKQQASWIKAKEKRPSSVCMAGVVAQETSHRRCKPCQRSIGCSSLTGNSDSHGDMVLVRLMKSVQTSLHAFSERV